MDPNLILAADNTSLAVTGFLGTVNPPQGGTTAIKTLNGLPLGTSDGSATGTVALKVLLVGGSVTVANETAAPNIALLGASSTQVILAGSKGWSISILSGTATINGAAVSAGFSDSDPSTLGASITVITAAASSAYIRYGS